jgi:hypothetical protein
MTIVLMAIQFVPRTGGVRGVGEDWVRATHVEALVMLAEVGESG